MKTSTYKGSIQKKFTKAIFFLVFFVSFIGYAIFVGWYIHDQKIQRIELAKDISQVLSQDFVRLILLDDLGTATDITTKLQVFSPVHKVVLFNNDHQKIFKYISKKKLQSKTVFKTKRILLYKQEKYGELYFEFEIESIWEILKNNFFIFFFFLLGFLVFSFTMAYLYAKRFSKPILYLVNFLEKIEFDQEMQQYKLTNQYNNEFGKLYEEINILLEKMLDYISQRNKAQEELRFLVQYDPLTGLLNKNGFLKTTKKLFSKQQLHWNIMFYIKITNLKTINHVYGFKAGDILLDTVAKNIKEHFNDSTLSARVGTGDFILLYHSINTTKNKTAQTAQNIADALIAILETPVAIHTKSIKPEVYVGIDIFQNIKDPLEILKHTNIALEIARKKQKHIVYFDPSNEQYLQASFNIYEELLHALQRDELELFYQLQYDQNEQISGAEALIRWRHPKYGLLTPDKFIPIAERTNLIIDIGKWVFQKACEQLQIWENDPIAKNWVISINVSAKQFHEEDFVDFVTLTVKKYNANTQKIKLELLESLFVEDQEDVTQKMLQLKSLHFNLSLDDFGTGFSSLQYLKVFPLDQIKIDQTFVRGIFENEKNAQIIKSIIYLGSLLDIEVIAEGVEEKKHYKILKKLGCKYFQGYYFAYPRSIEEIKQTFHLQN